MKVFRGTVNSNADLGQKGSILVDITELEGPVNVNYMSPLLNADSGFFAPPDDTSEVLVLQLDTVEGTKEGGYYYLGSLSDRRFIADLINPALIDGAGFMKDVEGAASVKSTLINQKSLGSPSPYPPNIPMPFHDAYANEVTPSKMGLTSKGGGGIIMANQKRGGDSDAWINVRTRLQNGTGMRVDLIDTPAQDHILITTGKDATGKENSIKLAGSQEAEGATSNILESGEFNVTSRGPTKILSKGNGIELRTGDAGLNIDIINNSDGFLSPSPKGRRMTSIGGGDAYPVLWDEIEEDYLGQPISVPSIAGNALRDSYTLPLASTFSAGQIHPDLAKTLPVGFNPMDKGSEDWGCVNIKTKWNNINLEAEGVDSVIHITAPGPLTKVVVTTGGTVDIIATGKISLTSDTKIELNAPHVDINTPAAHPLAPGGLGRVDID